MVRVLHIVSIMHRGGIETMIMNYYRHIDRTKIQFDFVEHGTGENDYDEEIRSLGGRIFNIPPKSEGVRKSLSAIENIVRQNQYKIVHVHMDAMNSFALYAAKKGGAIHLISHAHSTSMPPNPIKNIIYMMSILCLPRFANQYFSCSEASASYLYKHLNDKKKITYIHNAIETEKFCFHETTRSKMREKYKIANKFVVGHVGNFQYPKNHFFLLDVFCAYLKSNSNACLVLCGDGELKNSIKDKVKSLGIENEVMFAGTCSNISEFMQMFDILLHPSFYEGFPVVAVEAQCSDLPVIASDTITKEIKITENVCFLPIKGENAIQQWVETIQSSYENQKTRGSKEIEIVNSGFDICVEASALEVKYQKLIEERKI